jgi:hypothetical protein
MNDVMGYRSNASVGWVAEHGRVRQQKQHGELEPAAMIPVIGEETEDEDGGTLQVR